MVGLLESIWACGFNSAPTEDLPRGGANRPREQSLRTPMHRSYKARVLPHSRATSLDRAGPQPEPRAWQQNGTSAPRSTQRPGPDSPIVPKSRGNAECTVVPPIHSQENPGPRTVQLANQADLGTQQRLQQQYIPSTHYYQGSSPSYMRYNQQVNHVAQTTRPYQPHTFAPPMAPYGYYAPDHSQSYIPPSQPFNHEAFARPPRVYHTYRHDDERPHLYAPLEPDNSTITVALKPDELAMLEKYRREELSTEPVARDDYIQNLHHSHSCHFLPYQPGPQYNAAAQYNPAVQNNLAAQYNLGSYQTIDPSPSPPRQTDRAILSASHCDHSTPPVEEMDKINANNTARRISGNIEIEHPEDLKVPLPSLPPLAPTGIDFRGAALSGRTPPSRAARREHMQDAAAPSTPWRNSCERETPIKKVSGVITAVTPKKSVPRERWSGVPNHIPFVKREQSPPVQREQNPPVREDLSVPVRREQSPTRQREQSLPVKRKSSPHPGREQSPPVQTEQDPPVRKDLSVPVRREQSPTRQREQSLPVLRAQSPRVRREKSPETTKDGGSGGSGSVSSTGGNETKESEGTSFPSSAPRPDLQTASEGENNELGLDIDAAHVEFGGPTAGKPCHSQDRQRVIVLSNTPMESEMQLIRSDQGGAETALADLKHAQVMLVSSTPGREPREPVQSRASTAESASGLTAFSKENSGSRGRAQGRKVSRLVDMYENRSADPWNSDSLIRRDAVSSTGTRNNTSSSALGFDLADLGVDDENFRLVRLSTRHTALIDRDAQCKSLVPQTSRELSCAERLLKKEAVIRSLPPEVHAYLEHNQAIGFHEVRVLSRDLVKNQFGPAAASKLDGVLQSSLDRCASFQSGSSIRIEKLLNLVRKKIADK